ncbi:hypothetical protein AE921_11750 [Xanthomonas arboricola]|nr:hypothetical protein AKJ12_19405 [Xanthomonas arboricola pv. juglandis]KOA97999.1 hypothetical protein AE920_15990 [Xanthomonas arboricola]KOA99558.1 hypothetical protein AE921_11750 [Xanthomonas arboricola]KOB08397.1 hypothetical protein AE923_10745 [Xanthomonas arboricola]KOB11684.1 hypothetical protein AE922_00920 [Xanthomonas arboricola]
MLPWFETIIQLNIYVHRLFLFWTHFDIYIFLCAFHVDIDAKIWGFASVICQDTENIVHQKTTSVGLWKRLV